MEVDIDAHKSNPLSIRGQGHLDGRPVENLLGWQWMLIEFTSPRGKMLRHWYRPGDRERPASQDATNTP